MVGQAWGCQIPSSAVLLLIVDKDARGFNRGRKLGFRG
jgi:hypothetical protein